jgi:hypothetical protein
VPWILEELCKPHIFLAVIGMMLLVIIAISAGKGLGSVIEPIIKRLAGKEAVNINVGGEMSGKIKKECEQCGLIVDPSKCTLHASEHERSLRNEKRGEELATDLKKTRTELFGKLDDIEKVLTEIKVAVAKLVVERNYQMDHRETIRREGT